MTFFTVLPVPGSSCWRPSSLFFIIITSLFAPWLTIHDPFDPSSLTLTDAFTPPIWVGGGKWILPSGDDDQGRDILSTIMFGNRISLLVGFLSVCWPCSSG